MTAILDPDVEPDAGDLRLIAHLQALDIAVKSANQDRDQALVRERDMYAVNVLLQGQLDAVAAVNRDQLDEIRALHDVIERLQAENERLRGEATIRLPRCVDEPEPQRWGWWR